MSCVSWRGASDEGVVSVGEEEKGSEVPGEAPWASGLRCLLLLALVALALATSSTRY
jgi:hypothetical protein